MPPFTLDQWREANRQAAEAERKYFEVALAYAQGGGAKPSDELIAETKLLRDRAELLLAVALRELDAREAFLIAKSPHSAGESRR